MSNALGIASVTHVLKDLLYDGLIDANVSGVTGNPIVVSSLPPGELSNAQGISIPSQINMFLYRVSQNTGWNNIAFPTRGPDGKEIRGAPLAINLHYLLTAFGEQELHSEILLGHAMQILHENPVLYRDKINDSLTPATVADTGGRLPQHLKALATSGLADQVELIKITPENINTEEISKLWSAFQTKYRPCTGYLATVLLIESDKPLRSSLPVRERKLHVLPFRYPNISRILSKAPGVSPVLENRRITIGDTLVIQGDQLKSDPIVVKIGEKEAAPAQQDVEDTKISLQLTNAIGLKAGIHGLQVVHQVTIGEPPNDRDFRWASSNLLAFVLSPKITQVQPQNFTPVSTGNPLFEGNVIIDVEPAVQPRQRAVLLLNEINVASGAVPVAYSFVFPPANLQNPATSLNFAVTNLKSGDYLVRIQVDGAESPLETNSAGEYDDPLITVP